MLCALVARDSNQIASSLPGLQAPYEGVVRCVRRGDAGFHHIAANTCEIQGGGQSDGFHACLHGGPQNETTLRLLRQALRPPPSSPGPSLLLIV